ncbi:MAG: helix-turn-helix transcriptional regulator [Eubacterium sp.]|nr:helix-turn-helix transcriptional regulator [Eubacterium sp.]
MKHEKEKVEFRYYEVPKDLPVLALLGEEWEIPYGTDAMHFHNHLEIGYCYYGDGQICHGDHKSDYGDGTITIIPKNHPHRTNGDVKQTQKWEYLFVDADELLRAAYPDRQVWVNRIIRRIESRCHVLSKEENTELSMLLRPIFEDMRQKKEFYRECVKLNTLSLLLHIAQMSESDHVIKENGVAGESYELMLETLDYIGQHYMEDIRIDDLTRISNISESHYRRKFKEYFNTSPAEYINLVRIDHACELLAKTDEKIEDIAIQTGFQTTGSFTRNFKKLVGELPKDWRKKVKDSGTNLGNYNVSMLKGW